MVTVAPGKHRRPGWPPIETAPWPYGEAPPLLHPDHPSAPVPRVRMPPADTEAARLRAVMLSLSEQLSQLAACITEDLGSPPEAPVTRPARPASRHARPVTQPAQAARRPVAGTQGRQARAARKMVALLAALVTVGVVSGATELVLHGGPFFIFRANGAGATETGPVENQGPGQPDSPGAHHAPTPPGHAR